MGNLSVSWKADYGPAIIRGSGASTQCKVRHQPLTRNDEVNVGGAINVCGACRDLRIEWLIFMSPAAVYGIALPDAGRGGPRALQAYDT